MIELKKLREVIITLMVNAEADVSKNIKNYRLYMAGITQNKQ